MGSQTGPENAGPYFNWSEDGYAQSPVDWRLKNELGNLDGSSIVAAGATWLGTSLASARLKVVELDSDNKQQELVDHPAMALIESPNPYTTWQGLMKQFAWSWIVKSTVYIRKVRDRETPMADVAELWFEPHELTQARWPQDGSVPISHYEVWRNGQWYRVELDDMIVTRNGFNLRTREGMSLMSSLVAELFTDQKAAWRTAMMMQNGFLPQALFGIELEGKGATPRQISTFQQEIDRRMRLGESNALVTSGQVKGSRFGGDYSADPISSLRQNPERRFCAVSGISPISLMLGAGMDLSTYSNVEQFLKRDYRSVTVPLHSLIAQQLTQDLLTEFGTVGRKRFVFDYSEVPEMQQDLAKDAEWILKAWDSDALKRSEVRERFGYEWSAGLDDRYKSQLGLGPTSDPQPQSDADPDSRQPGFIQ
jgi:phage portal protein BeeE